MSSANLSGPHAEGMGERESALVARLSLEQKVRLLTGADAWVLHGESAVGLRPMVLSDGPAGVRGVRFDAANPSSSLPCPVALAATWDVELIEELTTALGREARSKGIDVLLGPTVNIVRTPLSGRGFECFSEDPFLTSRIAVAYVRGVQRAGVGATAKHFVANDSETERRTYDARISEGVLREVYLAPFDACVAEGGVFLVMAAYNSVNGATMTANSPLLRDLLKGEWRFPGVVVSDWSATTSTVPSAAAGLDLVMPGPDGPWGDKLVAAVRTGKVAEAEVDQKVARLLHLAQRVGALNGSADGDGAGHVAAPHAALIDPELMREAAVRSFVLLKNERGLLPLPAGSVERVALIGPNAIEPQLQGGGSVRVLPVVRPGIADALRDAIDAHVIVLQGALTSATIAVPAEGTLHDPVSGKAGVRLEIRGADGAVLYDAPHPTSVLTWWDGLPEAVHVHGAEVIMRARYRAEVDGPHVVGAAGVGQMRLAVGGSVVAEATSLPPRDVVEALSRPPELRVPVQMQAGHDVEVRVEYRPDLRFVTMRLGIAPHWQDERLIEQAAEAAAAADVAIVVVGSADGTESEGYDRESMALPGRQDELVRRVAAANRNTVVVVNSGMPVLMPWADEVAAIIQAWLPGQAFGEALADVLSGDAEPGGRLPVSLPRAEADSPVLRAHPDNGNLVYAEGLLVGYRGYDRRGTEPLFAFGHGLGYTDWVYQSIEAAMPSIAAGEDLEVVVRLRNAGRRAGREVVQLYVEGPGGDESRPVRTLEGFGNVTAEPGEVAEAHLKLRGRSFSCFDEASRGWVTPAGEYTIRAGRSSRDLRLETKVVLR
ncbi:MAG TPA: glycoside hydrolase family 3 C-terminal domain-containing protein [Candidatus Limnocylindrales bacterium]|nr:glycoside hydrolase family 3 C-terminal domain-containing protein [Candidatus Limnocylindrales bacterium]